MGGWQMEGNVWILVEEWQEKRGQGRQVGMCGGWTRTLGMRLVGMVGRGKFYTDPRSKAQERRLNPTWALGKADVSQRDGGR